MNNNPENKNKTLIRTRFSPSPSGHMHVGNMRTALFNWVFTRKNNGKFFLRLEDTDALRTSEEYTQSILETFKWMNIDFDKYDFAPYKGREYIRQTERYSIYNKVAEELLKKDFAYYCSCEELPSEGRCDCRNKNLQQGVLRFKVIDGQSVSFNDVVFGYSTVQTKEIEDFALLRSDKSPTYNFAVVVDDHESMITHVIRGEDHRTNTFKQVLIYQALNYDLPIFCHLPMIVGSDGKKMSKRKGDWSIRTLIHEGYLPEAVFNIILKIGWGYKNEEVFDRKRALEIFDLKDIKSGSCSFDKTKLYSFNGKHLRKYDNKNYAFEFCNKHLGEKLDEKKFNLLYEEMCKRSNTLVEMAEEYRFLLNKEITLPKEVQDLLKTKKIETFEDLDLLLREQANSKDLVAIIRKSITGKEQGLHLKFLFQCFKEVFVC